MYICTIELGIQNKYISKSVKYVLFSKNVFQWTIREFWNLKICFLPKQCSQKQIFLLVILCRMLFHTVLIFGLHEFRATVFQHVVRVPGGRMFIPRVSAGSFVEQLAHIRGIFHPFFSLAGTRTVLRFLPGACGTRLWGVRHILPDQQRGPFGGDVLSWHEKSLLIPSLCIKFQNLIDEIGQNGELVGIGGQVNFAKLDGVQENGYCGDRTVPPVHFFLCRLPEPPQPFSSHASSQTLWLHRLFPSWTRPISMRELSTF